MSDSFTFWRYRRNFAHDGKPYRVTIRSKMDGLHSEVESDGAVISSDHTPLTGEEALRNHVHTLPLPDGEDLHVEAGYISSLNTGIAVRHGGKIMHESHPGRTIAYPENYREKAVALASDDPKDAVYDSGAYERNKIPLAVDIALGLIFFVVAKLTDLTTAALVGAGLGLVLLIAQRITKIDFLGGLALFGIFMLLLSAGLAILFQSDEAVKYRTTALGLFTAALFFTDGLTGGKRLAERLKRYLPYADIDVARLGIGMGTLGAVMAILNLFVALLTTTDFWLFYSTFADFGIVMVLMLLVLRYSRGQMWQDIAPRYRDPRK